MEIMTKKHVLDTFSKQLLKNFDDYTANQQLRKNLENFTTYVIDRGLIADSSVMRYAIISTYNELKLTSEKSKTKIVNDLAEKFNLTPRTIWNALRANER